MADYAYYLAELVTGRVVTELTTVEVEEAQRKLGGNGTFSASIDLTSLPIQARRDIIETTKPGKYTFVMERDGAVFGEWIIWARTRQANDSPLEINGNEFLSYLAQRLVWWKSFSQVDQLAIAAALVDDAFMGHSPGQVTGATVVTPPASGRLRDREYALTDGADALQRLKELSEVNDGFEYDIATSWKSVSGTRFVDRRVSFYYPTKGTEVPYLIEISGDQIGGDATGSSLEVVENGRQLADQGVALGGELEDGTKVVGFADSDDLANAGYPHMQVTGSYYSVKEQPTINGHAAALLAAAKSDELPWLISVRGEGVPSVDDYDIGDRLWIMAESSTNFPDGAQALVRILAKSLSTNDGGEEIVELEVTADPNAWS